MGTLETRESGKVPKREEQHTEDNKRKSKVGRCRQKWSKQFSRDKLTFPFPYHSFACSVDFCDVVRRKRSSAA